MNPNKATVTITVSSTPIADQPGRVSMDVRFDTDLTSDHDRNLAHFILGFRKILDGLVPYLLKYAPNPDEVCTLEEPELPAVNPNN